MPKPTSLSHTTFRELGAFGFLLAVCIALAIRQPEFIGIENIKDVLVQVSGIAIAAAGMTFVIITAGIDLSVGSVLALSGCAGALVGLSVAESGPDWLVSSSFHIPLAVFATLLVGASCGLVNGFLITTLHRPPVIATLGMMSVARGLAFAVADSSPVQVLDGLRFVARARPAGIPFPILLMALTYILCTILLKYTVLGRYSYAIGGNEEAARLSGVRIRLCKNTVYALCGMLAAVSALIVAGRLAWMQPQEGDAFELDVIAAVVIGGTSLYGGEGTMLGTLVGALIMGVVRNGLNLMAMEYNVQKIIIGAIIIFAVAADVLTKRFVRR
jgi:ribose transport system permease protein